MSTPARKTMKMEPSTTPQWNPIPSLPYDLVLNCIARVSRLYYPTLSLVSKSFRSFIASPDLYKARSLLDQTESCLYVCLNIFAIKSPRTIWFTLYPKPDKTLTNEQETIKKKKKLSEYVLAKVPIPYSFDALYNSLVAVGSNIYNIGGSSLSSRAANPLYSSVSILDCTSHTWSVAPSLPVELNSLSATVVDQKIYVAGSYKLDQNISSDNSLDSISSSYVNSFHVLDTKTQIWDTLPIGTKDSLFNETLSIDGNFHVVTIKEAEGVAYDSNEGRWDVVGQWARFWRSSLGYCVIDKVLYSAITNSNEEEVKLKWYDIKVRDWRNLMGLVGLPKLPPYAQVGLADYGGKMAVLWCDRTLPSMQKYGRYKNKRKIWCAEIALEKRNTTCEIWGKVEWFDHMLTLDGGFDLIKVLAATV
ncbi:F-box/kelch-repeat protein [Cardamine amara subsp. amara]|uniref:F-box/kelch-repeat protein n=1 Tax=Cardamine amara subsp. amara TaxID=228776 RepID=A0ABD1ALM6_CARAN